MTESTVSWNEGVVTKYFFHINGKLHNIHGPAVIYTPSNKKEWWLYGVEFTEEGFNNLTRLENCKVPFVDELDRAHIFHINEIKCFVVYSKREERINFYISNNKVTEQEFKNNILKGMP